MSDGDEMGGRFSRAFLVLRSDEGRPETRKAAHHLDDGQPRKKRLQLARRRPHCGREHKARGPMLAHRADHLLLANRIFRGVGEKGDIGAALARLLDTDRELDIERVRQVVDDHADHAGLGAAQGRRPAMVDVAKFGHRVRRRARVWSPQRGSFRREPGKRSISTHQPGGRHRRSSRAPREPPSLPRVSLFTLASNWYVPIPWCSCLSAKKA